MLFKIIFLVIFFICQAENSLNESFPEISSLLLTLYQRISQVLRLRVPLHRRVISSIQSNSAVYRQITVKAIFWQMYYLMPLSKRVIIRHYYDIIGNTAGIFLSMLYNSRLELFYFLNYLILFETYVACSSQNRFP